MAGSPSLRLCANMKCSKSSLKSSLYSYRNNRDNLSQPVTVDTELGSLYRMCLRKPAGEGGGGSIRGDTSLMLTYVPSENK